ncbi:hypothetical protein Hanom_Chr08g00708921 [Helianthus anomalus]
MANRDETSKYKTHNIHRLTPLVLVRMKGSVTSSMFTNLFCKLSQCVCLFCSLCLLVLCFSFSYPQTGVFIVTAQRIRTCLAKHSLANQNLEETHDL